MIGNLRNDEQIKKLKYWATILFAHQETPRDISDPRLNSTEVSDLVSLEEATGCARYLGLGSFQVRLSVHVIRKDCRYFARSSQ